MKAGAILASGLLPAVFAIPAFNYKLHEQRTALQRGWTKGDAVDDSAPMPGRIALKQSNIDKAEAILLEISDPRSPKYGQHLTPTEIVDLFASSDENIDSVRQWLLETGVLAEDIKVSASRTWINFKTTAGQLGSLLKTQYHEYTSKGHGGVHFATDAYSLPQELSGVIDFVTPTISFPQVKEPARIKSKRLVKRQDIPVPDPGSLSTCDMYMTPKCIKNQYDIPDGALAQKGNEMGFFESDGDEWDQPDLDDFYTKMKLDRIPQGHGPKNVNIDGADGPQTNQTLGGSESLLDLEMAIPIIYPQSSIVYQVQAIPDPNNRNWNRNLDYFLDIFSESFCKDNGDGNGTLECNTQPVPNLLSISWLGGEDISLVPFHKRQCNEWMKLGLAGTTVFFASGDDGTGVRCPPDNRFVVEGPPACPYVTAVGGTRLPAGARSGDPEVVTDLYAPGGGFSNIFPTPAYQAKAVGAWRAKYAPRYRSYNITDGKVPSGGKGIYNRGGRGYPDIAAIGQQLWTVEGGDNFVNAGTSASTPIVAAMFNLINEDRIKAGRKKLGFINPALYQLYEKGGAFNDITIGSMAPSYNGNGSYNCATDGFAAAPGWDPVTGVGTPKYKPMHDFFTSLP